MSDNSIYSDIAKRTGGDSYIGVVKNNVIKVKKEGNKISFTSVGKDNLKELVTYYFDL